MSSESFHEPLDRIRPETLELHRAIVSLMEELDAVDWYQQRADATTDETLREVLLHHRDEEIEHAVMNLEWIRRKHPVFDRNLRTYLFTEAPITEIEEVDRAGRPQATGDQTSGASGGGLGVGSLLASSQLARKA